jgi:hypothetical protein
MHITKLKLQKIIQEELDIILQELEEEGPFGSSQPLKRAEAERRKRVRAPASERTKELAATGRIPPSEDSEAAFKRAAKRAQMKKRKMMKQARPAEPEVQKAQVNEPRHTTPPAKIRRRRWPEWTPGVTSKPSGPDTGPGI